MAGTVGTSTQSRPLGDTLTRHTITWVSDASGDATATITGVKGTILCVEFDPDTGGTQPTDAYDVVLNSAAGVDVLGGQGANLSNSTATAVVPGVPLDDGTTTSVAPRVVFGDLSLAVSNAGNAKGGAITIYTR